MIEVTPTADGADVRRDCGCLERLDPDWDALVVVEMCEEHQNYATAVDLNLPRLLDEELDHYIKQANEGHRVERLRPRDTTRGK